jgi:hypothetical protein
MEAISAPHAAVEADAFLHVRLNRLKAALGTLTMPPERVADVPRFATSILLRAALASWRDLSRARNGGSGNVRKELQRVVERAVGLRDEILSLHRDTLAAIREEQGDCDDRDLLRVAEDLRKIAGATARAYEKFSSAADARVAKGSRRHRAAAVTRIAAHSFEYLTGQSAAISVDPRTHKAGGVFLNLLQQIFDALEIRASAEAQARALLKEKWPRKNGP